MIESCQGVVTAAVAERMGGYGTLCAAGTGSAAAPLDALRFLNLKPEQLQSVCTASLAGLKAAKVGLFLHSICCVSYHMMTAVLPGCACCICVVYEAFL